MIGRQNTGLIPGEAKHLIERNGIPLLRDDFDGSSLDNIFNVATAMQNVSDLLKPGGRCVLMNWSNSFPTAYAMLSPDWFMDFFAYHEYEDARVLVVAVDAVHGRVWRYDPLVIHDNQYGYQCSSVTTHETRATICFAEKIRQTNQGWISSANALPRRKC